MSIKHTKEFSFEYLYEWEDADNDYKQLVPLTIHCQYEPPSWGHHNVMGVPIEPDEHGTIEILSIVVKDTKVEYTVSKDTEERILAKAWEQL